MNAKLDNWYALSQSVKIRNATETDKSQVLEFCKDTFSWGDYIADVWNNWASKKGLYIIEKNGMVTGVYNLSHHPKQTWIEGMRVSPNFRRRGLGKQLLSHAESVSKTNLLRLVIESQNYSSINLVESMGYELEERWRLYSMVPMKEISCCTVANNITQLGELNTSSNTYAESWKWLPLEDEEIIKLIQEGRVVISTDVNNKTVGMAVWNRYEDFPNTFQLGFVNGTVDGILDVLLFARNKAHEMGCEKIQVFTPENITLSAEFLEKRSLFYLMKKVLDKKNL